jgi:hypothetical protein
MGSFVDLVENKGCQTLQITESQALLSTAPQQGQ